MENDADVGIVGAGPLGIELAVAFKRAGISTLHWEAGQIGSTMQWWAPGTRWFSSPERISIAGVPLITAGQEKATREEYLAYLRSVVLQFGLEINTHERVTEITPPPPPTPPSPPSSGGVFTVSTLRQNSPAHYRVRNLVLCTGGTACPRLLGIPGEDLPHVSHYFQDPHTYFQKNVLIVGGRNSAVEAALRCHRVGAQVSLSYRRAGLDPKDIKYWLYPEIDSLIRYRKISAFFETTLVDITPHDVRLRRADGEIISVSPDVVLLLTGYTADMSLFTRAGVELREARQVPAFDERTMETNVPGLYVAGTAIAGTQERYRVFLENCHVHVDRILAAITGRTTPSKLESIEYARPES